MLTPRLCQRRKKSNRLDILIKKGQAKIDEACDVVTLIKTQNRLKIIERLIFGRQRRALLKLDKENFLKVNNSSNESEKSVSLSD
jgi:hypothetical protein